MLPQFRKRNCRKHAKGVRGCFSTKAELSSKKTMPLPPFENPQHPILGAACLKHRGGVTTPCLRLFLQLLFVGTPTERDGTRSQPFVCSALGERRLSAHLPRWTVPEQCRLFLRSDSPAKRRRRRTRFIREGPPFAGRGSRIVRGRMAIFPFLCRNRRFRLTKVFGVQGAFFKKPPLAVLLTGIFSQ